ncbi:uncharacterized protein LOC104907083 [Beta vulgaris subsp. vulgaris]|uniref:uncharacterized protein LOC104907083 n=1 Tax=Beta vulgaris subsp. vulgaris TaxID=3555 RepID=UPI002036CC65|nr:uncharacterized protein LOC104907083 [Beta vulgaris subsp. vulgaris]
MDPKLHQAAATGNLILFQEALASCITTAAIDEYLLSQKTDINDNIIHVTADCSPEAGAFIVSEVMEKMQLPPLVKVALICQQNKHKSNPLHKAATKGHLQNVKILIESYHKFSKITNDEANTVPETRVTVGDAPMDDLPAPWLAVSYNGKTPLHMAIEEGHEEVAAYILSQDLETLCKMVDYFRKSPLYLAVEKGMERVALQILTSDCSYSLGHPFHKTTLLHSASQITEQVAKILIEKHAQLLRAQDSFGETFLHCWASRGELQPLQCLLKDNILSTWSGDYKNILSLENNSGNNPLHCAIYSNKVEVVKRLIDAYVQLSGPNEGDLNDSPLVHQNCYGETPLHKAIGRGCVDIALYLLSLDSNLASINIVIGTSPLFLAVECGCTEVVDALIRGQNEITICGPRGQNPLHIGWKCPDVLDMLVEMLGKDLIEMKDEAGKAPLDYAAAVGEINLMKMAFNHSGIHSAPYAWIEACKGGHMDAFRIFMNRCNFRQLCIDQRDTPLHHMKLETKEEYQEFLQIPLMEQLKNSTDSDGATPLHRAIEREDIVLVELLLGTPDINWTIKNTNGQTALDLLAKQCDELPDWVAMCKRIGINPRIKTTYIPLKTNLAEVRTTLSVVAALLATITFAAGFTIPGGFKDDGYAIFARNAAFIVFLLSDTYAMCCSMLVLFILIWAMVCDPDESLILIDRSIVILQQALYGTLVAFMSGVYTVVSHNCLWTAIVVCVMCSLVAVVTNKSVLYRLLKRFVPSTR